LKGKRSCGSCHAYRGNPLVPGSGTCVGNVHPKPVDSTDPPCTKYPYPALANARKLTPADERVIRGAVLMSKAARRELRREGRLDAY